MLRKVSIFLMFLLCYNSIMSQGVGVVLSGGGAGGISHIGVLKALEENDIPIDFIAGTSIGALIGGLYAAGYSPAEIEAIFVSERFEEWANGKLNPKYQYYYRKNPDDASWINFKFSLDTLFETNLPTSYINPFPVDYGLMKLFAAANAKSMSNYDSLFIPFRCVGADISNKQLEIFKAGDLATSVRASMSYPFFLSPIEIDGKLFFDGGIYNNFPTDLMCENFNPDFIIGSNSSSNFEKPKADNVLSQIKYMLSQRTSYEINCENGIIIEPSYDINIFDFSKNQEIIDSAYRETLHYIDSIKQSVKSTRDKKTLAQKRNKFRGKLPEVKFDQVEMTGVSNAEKKYITRLLKIKKDTIGLDRLEKKLTSLSSNEKIKSLYPKASYKPSNDFYKLNLDIEKEKKFFLSFGGNISNKPINQGFIGLQYNYLGQAALTLKANGYFGQFYGSAQGGGKIDFLFPTPFYLKTNFISNRWNYFESDNIIIEDNDPTFLITRENFVELGLGIPVGYKGKLELNAVGGGSKFEYYQDNTFTQFDTTDITRFNNTAASLTYERNSLDRKMYASKGSQLMLKAKYTHGKEETTPGSTAGDKTIVDLQRFWYNFNFKYDKYYIPKGKVRFGTLLEATYSDQPLFANYVSSLLIAPSFEPIPELKTIFQERYRAYSFIGGGLKMVYSITNRVDLRMEAYVFQPFEEIIQDAGNTVRLGNEFEDRYYIGTATTVFHTPIGPLAISLNYYNVNVDNLSLMAHFGYVLFNRKMSE